MHRPPILGRWLFDELTHKSDMSASLATRQSGRSLSLIVQAQGKDPTNVGAQSMRQGKGVELFHAQAPITTVMQAR